jgi:hypothetical protein
LYAHHAVVAAVTFPHPTPLLAGLFCVLAHREHEHMSLRLVERVVARHNATTPHRDLLVSPQMLGDIKDLISGNTASPRFQDRPWMLQVGGVGLSGGCVEDVWVG